MKEKINLRPSSLSAFVNCSWQWYNVFILGKLTIPSARAMIGSSIHAGIETMWLEAMKTKDKNPNMTAINDSAIEAYDNAVKTAEGNINYDEDLNDNYARAYVVSGTKAFVEDILPFTAIPDLVEQTFIVSLKHNYVEKISGTIDYVKDSTIADIKTSKRKVVPQSYSLQQGLYKYLADAQGYNVDKILIQGIVLAKTKTVGGIDSLEVNVNQIKFIVNNLLDRLTSLDKGLDPKLLFPGNPKYYLCNDKYCNLRATCPFVKGE